MIKTSILSLPQMNRLLCSTRPLKTEALFKNKKEKRIKKKKKRGEGGKKEKKEKELNRRRKGMKKEKEKQAVPEGAGEC